MKLSEIKALLQDLESVNFALPNGEQVPNHFHVTEVGQFDKRFIDCGGTMRTEATINFQLWSADDHDHRLSAQKLKAIIELSEQKLELQDHEIEVEYQGDTIGKYDLGFDGTSFQLLSKKTDCLAKDNCGIPTEKPKIKLSNLVKQNDCSPGSGCC